MDLSQHDTAERFLIRLYGDLEGKWVAELEQVWCCAASVLKGRELAVDLTGLTSAEERGTDLLIRMREGGARLIASWPARSPQLARRFAIRFELPPDGAPRGILAAMRALLRRFRPATQG